MRPGGPANRIYSRTLAWTLNLMRRPSPLLLISLTGLFACTNYTATEIPVNPAILLGPSPSGTSTTTGISALSRNSAGGIVFTVGAHNVEPTFKGYRLFVGTTESDVVTQADSVGTDCGAFINYPVSAIAYTMEASTTPLLTSAYLLCVFPVNLTAGAYVAIRSRYFAGFGLADRMSMSSNALVVP